MKRFKAIFMCLLAAFSVAGATQARAVQTGIHKTIHTVGSQMAEDNTNTDDQARTTARRRPSGNLRQRPTPPAPAPAPAPRAGFGGGIGRFFGGMAAGALLGSVFSSMLHPFGGFGAGFTLIGLLLDAVLIYIGFRLIRRLVNRNYGR